MIRAKAVKRIDRLSFRQSASSLLLCAILMLGKSSRARAAAVSLRNSILPVNGNPQDGSFAIHGAKLKSPVLIARVSAKANRRWLWPSGYLRHEAAESSFQDALESGGQAVFTFAGLKSAPDLACVLRTCNQLAYGTVEVQLQNHLAKEVSV